MNKIFGISLGPGDPELLTLKALKVLQDSDLICFPGSVSRSGSKDSYVLPMLTHHQLPTEKLYGFYLQMGADRTAAEATYEETTAQLISAWKEGKKISIVCEGDLSFYASFSYILNKLQRENIPVELIPGVNSFSLAAARHQIPLVLQHEKLAVLPLTGSITEVERTLENFDTVILMKISRGWAALRQELLQKDWKCFYCERLGTPAEFITADLLLLQDREIPYFSLLIIKK